MSNEKLEVGEKYLSIKIIGHDYINVFKNKNKKSEKEPDFVTSGVGVWVRKKKSQEEQGGI